MINLRQASVFRASLPLLYSLSSITRIGDSDTSHFQCSAIPTWPDSTIADYKDMPCLVYARIRRKYEALLPSLPVALLFHDHLNLLLRSHDFNQMLQLLHVHTIPPFFIKLLLDVASPFHDPRDLPDEVAGF
ncbi:hypothetical protein Tco_1136837 [Tanacetum coccineum]